MTDAEKKSFLAQFEESKRTVQALATTNPELFPQWHNLQQAASDLAYAQRQLERAQRAWAQITGE